MSKTKDDDVKALSDGEIGSALSANCDGRDPRLCALIHEASRRMTADGGRTTVMNAKHDLDQRDSVIELQATRLTRWLNWARGILVKRGQIASHDVPTDARAMQAIDELMASDHDLADQCIAGASAELRAERDKLSAWYLRCCEAIGIVHQTDHGSYSGPIAEVERAIKKACAERDELRVELAKGSFKDGYDAGYSAAEDGECAATFDAYTRERLAAQGETRPTRDRLAVGALGLAGESGEVVEHVKKHLYHGKDLDKDAVIKELGDVLWYVMFTADAIGSSLEDVAVANNAKLRERYPNGFSVVAAAKVTGSEIDKPAHAKCDAWEAL